MRGDVEPWLLGLQESPELKRLSASGLGLLWPAKICPEEGMLSYQAALHR